MFPIFTETTAQDIKRKIEQIEGDELVACWDQSTGFLYAAHCVKGIPIYVECCGPIDERQAIQTAESMGLELNGPSAILKA